MAVNKVVYNTENGERTLIDLTNDTVTPSALAEGETAHAANGETIVGTLKTMSPEVYDPQGKMTDIFAYIDEHPGPQGPQGEQGVQGERGETGDSGVYIGANEPTDPEVRVWIKPDGTTDARVPVKGEDYWTEADKAEIINDILTMYPVAEGGSY